MINEISLDTFLAELGNKDLRLNRNIFSEFLGLMKKYGGSNNKWAEQLVNCYYAFESPDSENDKKKVFKSTIFDYFKYCQVTPHNYKLYKEYELLFTSVEKQIIIDKNPDWSFDTVIIKNSTELCKVLDNKLLTIRNKFHYFEDKGNFTLLTELVDTYLPMLIECNETNKVSLFKNLDKYNILPSIAELNYNLFIKITDALNINRPQLLWEMHYYCDLFSFLMHADYFYNQNSNNVEMTRQIIQDIREIPKVIEYLNIESTPDISKLNQMSAEFIKFLATMEIINRNTMYAYFKRDIAHDLEKFKDIFNSKLKLAEKVIISKELFKLYVDLGLFFENDLITNQDEFNRMKNDPEFTELPKEFWDIAQSYI